MGLGSEGLVFCSSGLGLVPVNQSSLKKLHFQLHCFQG